MGQPMKQQPNMMAQQPNMNQSMNQQPNMMAQQPTGAMNSSFNPNMMAQQSGFDPNAGSSIPLQKQAAPVVKAKALYPFQGQDASELTFQFNEEIIVLRQGGEWWEGELNGRRGLFPSNYVKLC